jgi:hypothetical protein
VKALLIILAALLVLMHPLATAIILAAELGFIAVMAAAIARSAGVQFPLS